MKYYVYVGIIDNVIVYVGKGTKDRLLHINSGTSSCYQANKFHFGGGFVNVMKYAYFYEEKDALNFEAGLIKEFLPEWNIINNVTNPQKRTKQRRKSKKASSIYMGVEFYKNGIGGKRSPKKHWRAFYNKDGIKQHIGYYETEVSAGIARDKFLVESNISGYSLNFPEIFTEP